MPIILVTVSLNLVTTRCHFIQGFQSDSLIVKRFLRTPSATALSGAGWLALGQLTGQVVTLLGLLLLARLYTPAEFGLWAIFIGITGFSVLVTGMRFDLAVIIAKRTRTARALAGLVLWLSLFGSGLLAALAILFAIAAPHVPYADTAVFFLFMLAMFAWSSGFITLAGAWMTRTHYARKLMLLRVLLPVFTMCLQLVGGYAGAHNGLIAGTVAGNVILAVMLMPYLTRIGALHLPRARKQWLVMWAACRLFRRFPLWSMPYSLVGNAVMLVTPVLMGAWYSLATAGNFGLLTRTLLAPVGLFGQAVGQALTPVLAQAKNLKLYEQGIFDILYLIIWSFIPAMVVLEFWGPDLYGWLFGQQWRFAGTMASTVMLMAMASALLIWLERIYDVLGRQKENFIITTLFSLLIIGALAIGHVLYPHEPHVSLAFWSGGFLAYTLVWLYYGFRYAGFSDRLFRAFTFEVFGLLFAYLAFVLCLRYLALPVMAAWSLALIVTCVYLFLGYRRVKPIAMRLLKRQSFLTQIAR